MNQNAVSYLWSWTFRFVFNTENKCMASPEAPLHHHPTVKAASAAAGQMGGPAATSWACLRSAWHPRRTSIQPFLEGAGSIPRASEMLRHAPSSRKGKSVVVTACGRSRPLLNPGPQKQHPGSYLALGVHPGVRAQEKPWGKELKASPHSSYVPLPRASPSRTRPPRGQGAHLQLKTEQALPTQEMSPRWAWTSRGPLSS